MQLCFFEDKQCTNFHPLTLSRPTDDLRIGIFTIADKWKRALEASSYNRLLRTELSDVFGTGEIASGESRLFINSRYLPEPSLLNEVKNLAAGSCLQFNDTVIAARVDEETAEDWIQNNNPRFETLFVVESQDFLSIEHLWDLFQLNGLQIKRDLELINLPGDYSNTPISPTATLENSDQIFIEESAAIEAGAILNAEQGPIYIGKNATIMAGSMIRGPVAVCDEATVKMGAKIYGDTTIGPVCKVGGEVNNCIFHSYTNKAHDGFVGNSLFGQWCNLGADTNTSNLKNNYSPIRISNWTDEKEIETGQQFFGAVLGDHTKTAINTQLNTGTICGVSCNIFSADFPPKYIPSFSWVGSNVIQTYRLEKACEAMEAMMARRDVEFTEEYKALMQQILMPSTVDVLMQ